MSQKFFGRWDSYDAMVRDFTPYPDYDSEEASIAGMATEDEIVWASYDGGSYDGSATVIYKRYGDNLFEVHGSHCSCYGLEGQWDPSAVLVQQLQARPLSAGGYDEIEQVAVDAWRKLWPLTEGIVPQ